MHYFLVFLFPLFLIIGIFQLWLGYIGIQDWLGAGWATGALLAAIFLRLMLPLTIGTYLAVVNVFEYPWWVGVLAAAPGLIFVLPTMITKALNSIRKKHQ
jgi:hypothetical protein